MPIKRYKSEQIVTRVAREKPCKQRQGMVIGQSKDRHDLERKFLIRKPACHCSAMAELLSCRFRCYLRAKHKVGPYDPVVIVFGTSTQSRCSQRGWPTMSSCRTAASEREFLICSVVPT